MRMYIYIYMHRRHGPRDSSLSPHWGWRHLRRELVCLLVLAQSVQQLPTRSALPGARLSSTGGATMERLHVPSPYPLRS